MNTYTQAQVDDIDLVSHSQEIITWCQENRPDLVPIMTKILNDSSHNGQCLQLIAAIAFSAGREFQHLNPQISVKQPI